MTRRVSVFILLAALMSLSMPVMAQQYFIYAPKTTDAIEKVQPAAGEILVREIVVKKGDTLSGLSKRFSGKGFYYPQILLFNEIKNPHLIQVGQTVRVPVKEAGKSAASADISKKAALAKAPKSRGVHKQPAISKVKPAKPETLAVPRIGAENVVTAATNDPQKFYEKGTKAYDSGDCRAAIAFFDRFLSDYPTSAQAAEAGLYKADCLLKLSGQ